MATCLASGDPHYVTFNKNNIHFQGVCKYNLASSTANHVKGGGIPDFRILTKNERRGGNDVVTYVRYVELLVYGHTVRLDRDNIVYVSHNGHSGYIQDSHIYIRKLYENELRNERTYIE